MDASMFCLRSTGLGKTWLSQALTQKAFRNGYSVLYRSSAELFRDLTPARADNGLGRLFETRAPMCCW